jgi:hypothetical protein
MNYTDIKTFSERCEGKGRQLPAYWTLKKEVAELRAYIEEREWVGLTYDERLALFETAGGLNDYAKAIEAKLKDKNI